MQRIIYVILLQVFLIGCSTLSAGQVRSNMSNLNHFSGVGKEDAVAIAKDYMVKMKIKAFSLNPKSVNLASNKYTSNVHSFYYVDDQKYQDKTLKVWEVSFSCKAPGLLPISLPCSVHVNTEDGVVVFQHMDTM